jgi:PAS domain S-box-containing protein
MMLASVAAIGIVAMAALLYEQTTFKPRAVLNLRQQADTLAAVVLPPVEFGDTETATTYLATRREYPDIVAVGLYDFNARRLATYVRDDSARIDWPRDVHRDRYEFVNGKLHLWHPIEDGSRVVGYLFFCADIPPLFARLPQYGIMAGAVLLALLAVAGILSRGLQRAFLLPVEQLTAVTEQVTQHRDYALRAPVTSGDELGRLAAGLNDMLATVASRDHALRHSEARMRSIVETEPESVTIISKDIELVEINPAGLALLEAESIAQLRQHPLVNFVAEEFRDQYMAMHQRVLAGERAALEYQAVGLRGTRLWLDTRAVPWRSPGGAIIGVLSITRDVTNHKQFEHALARRSQQQAVVLQLGLEALTAATLDALFDRAADTVASALGADYTAVLQVLPGRDKALVRAGYGWADGVVGNYELPLATNTPAGITLQHQTSVLIDDVANDARLPIRTWHVQYEVACIACVAIRGTGQPWGILAAHSKRTHAFSANDVSALQEVANVLAQSIQRANADVARTEMESQLLQAQKMDALGRLAGGIAHDFNNLLSAILGNAQLAREDVGVGHPSLVSLEQIQNAGRRAKELVQRILTFSRQQTPRREPVSLQPIIDEVARLLRATIPAGVTVDVSIAPDVPLVSADGAQIHQTLLNLGTNAWQAINGACGHIQLSLSTCDADAALLQANPGLRPGQYVCVTVADNGVGVDAALQGRIFDPFFTTKPPGEGTGLGLSVVLGIMQAHGGAVTVSSEKGQGAKFSLYFPEVTPSARESKKEVFLAQANSGRGERILYLDDEESLVFLATRLLERAGYRVDGHVRADQALAAFAADPRSYSLVITDLSMPGMSGMDVAREILNIQPDAVVVLASGYVRQMDVDAAMAVGIREVILKPNTVDELAPIVHRLLNETRAAQTISN